MVRGITILGLLLASLVAMAILYPDDPGDRAARIRRTLAAVAVFAVATNLAATVVETPASGWARAAIQPDLILWMILLGAVPFSAAERIAGLFRPRRTPAWAAAGIATGLGWSGLLYLLFRQDPDPPLPWPAVAATYIVPGLAAGLAWHALLPRRAGNVGAVFE